MHQCFANTLLFEFWITRNHKHFCSFAVGQCETNKLAGYLANPSIDRSIKPLGNGLWRYSNFSQVCHAEMVLFCGNTNIEYALNIRFIYLSKNHLLLQS